MCELDADRCGWSVPHSREPARRDEPPGFGQEIGLGDAVLVPPHVRDEHGLGWELGPEILEDSLGREREVISAAALLHSCPHGVARFGDGGTQARLFDAVDTEALRRLEELRERLVEIRDRTERDRIVPSDLGRVDVDLNQSRRWDLEAVAWIPGACVRLCKSCPEREDEVSLTRRIVAVLGAPEAEHSDDERVIVGHAPFAHKTVGDR